MGTYHLLEIGCPAPFGEMIMRDYQWTAYIGFESLLFACLSIAVLVLGRRHFSAREMLRKMMHAGRQSLQYRP